jgi:hypothetical protein
MKKNKRAGYAVRHPAALLAGVWLAVEGFTGLLGATRTALAAEAATPL